MDNYKYYIIDSALVQTEVFPITKNLQEIEYERQDKSSAYFEKKLTGKLIFGNNPKESIFDFNYFKDKEENDRCFELKILITKKCNGVYSLFYEGVFSVLEGEFDNDRCTYEISPRLKFNIQSDIDVNMLDAYSSDGSYTIRTGAFASERAYSNGRALYYVLLHLAQQSSPNVVDVISDFFSINAVGDIDYTDYFMQVGNYSQLKLLPLSEVQEPVPSNRAVKEFVSLDKLMQDLNVLFDVYWFIDENFNLRIEHQVFFNRMNGLDLTGPEYEKYLVGTNKISYNLDDFPKYETWKINGSKQYCRIAYAGCGDINKNTNEKIYSTNVLSTDYYNIRYDGGGSGDANGIFIMACYQSLGLFRLRENSIGQNYLMQSALLVQNFHRYERPSSNNTLEYYEEDEALQIIAINQGSFLPYSTIPTKIQTEIKVPLCCGTEFDPFKKITTNLGVGYLDSAKFSMKTNMLELKLKYKTEPDNFLINPNQISGCRLWLTADTGVVYSSVFGFDRISEWQDQSGYGNHAGQTNAALRPYYDSVNKELLFFTTYFLETPSFQLFPSKRGSVFILGYHSSTSAVASGEMSIISTSAANGFDVSYELIYTAGSPAGTTAYRLKSYELGQYFPRNTINGLIQINRESDTTQTMYSNGLKPSVLTGNPLTIPNIQVDPAPLIIGRNSTFADYGSFNIKEVIAFDRVVTDLERQQIELYLANKWGIPLYQEY